ncbi:MAG: hypothetical protein MK212_15190 [Saprospiraceae bacterium]|nr:hypothetical protein [Saprospiraceae bacterium]
MNYLGYILLGLSLIWIIRDDFMTRTIRLEALVLMLLGSSFIIYLEHPKPLLIGFNLSFILVQLILLSIYFSIKHRQWINISKDYLGLGDILFFIPLSLLFSPFYFVVFFVLSLSLILSIVLIRQVFFVKAQANIPLAAALSLTLLLFLSLEYGLGWDRYNDLELIQTIHF